MSHLVLVCSKQGQIAQSVLWLISYWLNERENVVPIVAGVRDFSLLANAQTESGTHTASHSMGTRGSSLAVNRPGRDVNHLSSSRAEDQNEWIYTYVGLQYINRENLLLLCANYIKWRLQLPYFSFSLLPKAPPFCANCSQRNFQEAGVLLALEKSRQQNS